MTFLEGNKVEVEVKKQPNEGDEKEDGEKVLKEIFFNAWQISEEDIIGTIRLSDKGLKNSKNFVSTSIIDPNNKFEGRSVSFFNSVL